MRARAHHTSDRPGVEDAAEQEARRLRDGASHAVLKGRYTEALAYCQRLETMQPGDPTWARRTAYCCSRLGRRTDERAALLRAADGYERAGFLRKACAMYRLAIAIDPSDTHLEQRLAALDAERATGLDSLHPPGAVQFHTPSERPPPITSSPGSSESQEHGVDLIPGAPLVPAVEHGEDDYDPTGDSHLVEFTDPDVGPT